MVSRMYIKLMQEVRNQPERVEIQMGPGHFTLSKKKHWNMNTNEPTTKREEKK
jgi:hypothetical protein